MPTRSEDLMSTIAELEATLATADPESRAVVQQQLDSVRQVIAMLEAAQADSPPMARLPLSDEMRGFFTPDPPAAVPAWIPDTLTRAEVTDELMRCPAGAQVYPDDRTVGCAVPQGPGSVPRRNGLELGFSAVTGRLAYQRFYEDMLLRWAVEYHSSGGRASVGFHVGTERLEYPEDGLQTAYAPNGTVVSQTWFRAGVRHGWSKLWEDDGSPLGATRYDAGVAVEEVYPDGTRRNPRA